MSGWTTSWRDSGQGSEVGRGQWDGGKVDTKVRLAMGLAMGQWDGGHKSGDGSGVGSGPVGQWGSGAVGLGGSETIGARVGRQMERPDTGTVGRTQQRQQ